MHDVMTGTLGRGGSTLPKSGHRPSSYLGSTGVPAMHTPPLPAPVSPLVVPQRTTVRPTVPRSRDDVGFAADQHRRMIAAHASNAHQSAVAGRTPSGAAAIHHPAPLGAPPALDLNRYDEPQEATFRTSGSRPLVPLARQSQAVLDRSRMLNAALRSTEAERMRGPVGVPTDQMTVTHGPTITGRQRGQLEQQRRARLVAAAQPSSAGPVAPTASTVFSTVPRSYQQAVDNLPLHTASELRALSRQTLLGKRVTSVGRPSDLRTPVVPLADVRIVRNRRASTTPTRPIPFPDRSRA